MFLRTLVAILMVIALSGRCESLSPGGAYIFIEQKPPSTSEDTTAKSTAVYLNEKGLVQRYACKDYLLVELQEGSLPAAGTEIFKSLSAIALKSLPGRPSAGMDMPSQAQPGHARVMLRQPGGAEYLWEGNDDKVPPVLKKLVQDSLALAGTLKADKFSAGAFVRADVLGADRLDEYRANKLLKTVKNPDELDPVLRDALANPYRLLPVPGGEQGEKWKSMFSVFAIKGGTDSVPLLYNGTGYEVSRHTVAAPTGP